MAVRDEQRAVVPPEVLSRVLDGETVVLDLVSGTYFGLNEVATRVWQLASLGKRVGEIKACLLDEFDVAPDAVDKDVSDLLSELVAKGLVRLEDG